MTTPVLLQLHGLEVVNLHPHQWEVAIDRVRQALQSLVVDWRLISVVAPRSLASRRQRIHDQLRLLDPSDPRHPRLTAQLLHMQDLEQHAMTSMTHYLVVWCPPSLAHTTVEHTLGRACGGATRLSSLPLVLGAPTVYMTATTGVADTPNGQRCWQGMLAERWHGSLSPLLFRPLLLEQTHAIIVVDARTMAPDRARTAMDVALQRLDAHAALNPTYDEARRHAVQDWQAASTHLERGALLHTVQVAVFVGAASPALARTQAQAARQALGSTISFSLMLGRQPDLLPLLGTRATATLDLPTHGHPMITAQLATLLPIYLAQRSHPPASALLAGVDEVRGTPLLLDLTALPALHGFFCGATGSGKSSYVATIGSRLVDDAGYQLILLDPQGAFVPLADAYAGRASVNRVALDTLRLNLLDPIVDLQHDLVTQVLHVEEVLQWLLDGALSQLHRQTLRRVLSVIYATHAAPRLSDVVALLAEDTTGLRDLLLPWTLSPFAEVFDQPSTMDLTLDPSTPVVIYDVSDAAMPEHIKQFFLILIASAIQREIRLKPRKAIIGIDEAGVLFANPLLASFAERLAKTARRFGAGVWVIDQTTHLLETKAGAEIFENSFITVIGTMRSDQLPALRERFPMVTDSQLQWITGLGMTDEQRQERAGQYLIIINETPYLIYNHLSHWEWQLIPQRAVLHTEVGHGTL